MERWYQARYAPLEGSARGQHLDLIVGGLIKFLHVPVRACC